MSQHPRRQRFTLALVALLLWFGLAVEGSQALFTDQAMLTGSALTTGSTNLLISNSQNPSSTTYEETRPGFPVDLVPGESMEKFFLLKNVSSGPVTLVTRISANLVNAPADLASALTLEVVPVNADGEATEAPVSSSLTALAQNPVLMSGTILPNATQRYRLTYTLSPSYSAQAQAGGFDLIFTGQQQI